MSQQLAAPDVDSLGADTAAVSAPGRRVTSRHVRLAALPSAVPWARRVLRHLLSESQLNELSESALLVVSELVTNAVQASAHPAWPGPGKLPMIALSLHVTDTTVRTEVWDASPAVPALRESDVTGDRGRGLLLVDFLADAWGHRAAAGGKVVWCEVAVR